MADEWKEDTVDDEFMCTICLEVMIEPTSACPEGHCCCRVCYVKYLRESAQQQCVTCLHPTDESRLVRNRHLENVINKLRVKCKHAAEGAKSGDAPSRTAALVGLPIKELRTQLRRACLETQGAKDALVARLVAWQDAQECNWRGTVGLLTAHLASSCPAEAIKCPNAGCARRVLRRDMSEHRRAECEFEAVACPCLGCTDSVLRGALLPHLAAGAALHAQHTACKLARLREDVDRRVGEDKARMIAEHVQKNKLRVEALRRETQDKIAGIEEEEEVFKRRMHADAIRKTETAHSKIKELQAVLAAAPLTPELAASQRQVWDAFPKEHSLLVSAAGIDLRGGPVPDPRSVPVLAQPGGLITPKKDLAVFPEAGPSSEKKTDGRVPGLEGFKCHGCQGKLKLTSVALRNKQYGCPKCQGVYSTDTGKYLGSVRQMQAVL